MINLIKDKKIFENGTYKLVVCFYHNSNYESYERGYKSELWFEDGNGNKIPTPDFIFNTSLNIIGYKIKDTDDFHTLSDEILKIVELNGYNIVNNILYSENDAWYIGFS